MQLKSAFELHDSKAHMVTLEMILAKRSTKTVNLLSDPAPFSNEAQYV